MKKSHKLSAFALLLLFIFQGNLSAQETYSYKNEIYKVYPHERDANASWLIYNAVNRKNKKNLEVLYKNEIGDVSAGMDESDFEMGMMYWEMEVFGENSAKLKMSCPGNTNVKQLFERCTGIPARTTWPGVSATLDTTAATT